MKRKNTIGAVTYIYGSIMRYLKSSKQLIWKKQEKFIQCVSRLFHIKSSLSLKYGLCTPNSK